MPLDGRRALITGAGSGIGRASALRLAQAGAAVAVVDVREEAAAKVAAEIKDAGHRAIDLTCDVRDEPAVQEAVTAAADAFGGLDTVVAAAGIALSGTTHTMDLEHWELVLGVNLTGTFLVIKHALPHLVRGGGTITTIGSVASLVAAGRSAGYDASKGGVLQLTRAVAVEYADRGVRANCVCPGVVATGLAANSRSVAEEARISRTSAAPKSKLRVEVPIGRKADPSEMAAVVAFLCSDDASFITGAAIAADGGFTAV
ncbi:dihydroanticapsin 7-dehydrogenase [Actinomadura vinacea]|uniref:Dihydroanticapsin 7-dehydrogenase n=1 Tax=Actinomadura vinacea TaxID=115336 RepID=A0ABN3IH45_9ACTN